MALQVEYFFLVSTLHFQAAASLLAPGRPRNTLCRPCALEDEELRLRLRAVKAPRPSEDLAEFVPLFDFEVDLVVWCGTDSSIYIYIYYMYIYIYIYLQVLSIYIYMYIYTYIYVQ